MGKLDDNGLLCSMRPENWREAIGFMGIISEQ